MGGSSSSSKQSTSQTDNRRVIGQSGISAENSNVSTTTITNTLDGGAINRAFDTADFSVGKALGFAGDSMSKSLEFSGDTVSQAFSFAESAGANALDSLNTTTSLVKDAYADAKGRGAMTDNIMIAAIAMAGIVAFSVVRK